MSFKPVFSQEMKARIKEDDETVPYKFNDYWYQTKFKTNAEYPVYIRWKNESPAGVDLMFDCNEKAKGL